MSTDSEGSLTRWLCGLREGDDTAIEALWANCYPRLVRLARKNLRRTSAARTDEAEEDVALSAFYEFCVGARNGHFPRLKDRCDLWRILFRLTVCKAIDERARRRAARRGGGRVVAETDLRHAGDVERKNGWDLDREAARGEDPELAAQLADECRYRLEGLVDPVLRQVALMKLACYTNGEIGRALGCSMRTVGLKLRRVRRGWGASER